MVAGSVGLCLSGNREINTVMMIITKYCIKSNQISLFQTLGP